MSLVSLAVPSNKFPCEGPKTVPLTLDFSAAETKLVDLFQLTYSGAISFVVTLFVDNSENDSRLIIVSETSGQRIIVPPNGNGYVQIMAQNPARFQVTLEADPVAPFRVMIHANNFPTQSGFKRVPFVPIAPFPESLFDEGEQGFIFDNSDITTFYQDAAMTIPAVVNGLVGAQRDLSGNNNHRTIGTDGEKPNLRFDAINGIYYLDTTGDSRILATPAIDLSSTNKISLGWGFGKAESGGAFVVGNQSANGSFALYLNFPESLNLIDSVGVVTQKQGNLANPSTNTSIVEIDISQPTANNRLSWLNNGAVFGAVTIEGSGTGNFGNNPIYFFNNTAKTIPFNGPDYGGILTSRALTESERAQLQAWLDERTP